MEGAENFSQSASYFTVPVPVSFVCVPALTVPPRIQYCTGLVRVVSRLPPVSFYRSRVCPGSPRCL